MRINREVGSEFWDIPTAEKKCNIWSEQIQWYLCGRSALQAVIKDLDHVRSVAIPSWCCHTMVKPFTDEGIRVDFYPVYVENGMFIQELGKNCDALFLMDYFGYAVSEPDLSSYKGIVIRDVTHSIFSKSYEDADYYFGSLRKWCGVWTGGYAWAKDGHKLIVKEDACGGYYALLREEAMRLKNRYIHGCADEKGIAVTDKKYLEIFSSAEELLEDCGIAFAAGRDAELAKHLDVDFIKTCRRTNAGILMDAFPEWLVFREMKEGDCPLFVPILVPEGKRDALRRHLIEHDIYCPVHWPVSEYHRLDAREQYIYRNELSLVCDQRYGKMEMKLMVNMISKFWKGI